MRRHSASVYVADYMDSNVIDYVCSNEDTLLGLGLTAVCGSSSNVAVNSQRRGKGADIMVSRSNETRAGPTMTPDIAIAVLAMLGHRVRIEIWCALAPFGDRGLTAGTIATKLDMASSSLSFHLQQMTRVGLLHQQYNNRQIIYSVNPDTVTALCDFLTTTLAPALDQ
jgi:ArsR family transcriptional regulator